MAHTITHLYQVISTHGLSKFIEADNDEDMFEYIISTWMLRGLGVLHIYLWGTDGKHEIALPDYITQ